MRWTVAMEGNMRITASIETWPLANPFRISRNAVTSVDVVVATMTRDGVTGRGECRPYARYGETLVATRDTILAAWPDLAAAGDMRARLQEIMPAGAARNALDCALWDWEAKRAGVSVAELAGVGHLQPQLTAYTISLDTPDVMAAAARHVPDYPLLKLKLGGGALDAERMSAVRAARADARLIVDANEAWQADDLAMLFAAAAAARIELIEQPLPAADDHALAGLVRPVPVCADESMHGASDIAGLADRYDAINIKLDKTGGLTAALGAMKEAERRGLRIMVGCMVATSLAMAPALVLAHAGSTPVQWIDLDGPLLLAKDREPSLHYAGAIMSPAKADLWG
jgi:L-Ala-D/L-Glu epimerase